MKNISLIDRIKLALTRLTWRRFGAKMLSAYGFLWLILRSTTYFFKGIQSADKVDIKGFVLFSILAIIAAILMELPKSNIAMKLGNSEQDINIYFGDLFKSNGFKVIPVSCFMHETEVFKTSLQNILIEEFIDNPRGVEKGLNKYKDDLKRACPQSVSQTKQKSNGKSDLYYPLGTTINIENKGNEYLLFALTETENPECVEENKKNGIKNCSLSKLHDASKALWKWVSINYKDQTINIPLIGGGISGIELPAMQLLEYNLIVLLDTINELQSRITVKEINFIIYPPYYKEVDLRALKNTWKKKTK